MIKLVYRAEFFFLISISLRALRIRISVADMRKFNFFFDANKRRLITLSANVIKSVNFFKRLLYL